MRTCYIYLSLIVLILICFPPNIAIAQTKSYKEPASKGVLDLNNYDAPLSYIDRQPFQQDSAQKQQDNFNILNEYVQAQKVQQKIKNQEASAQLDKAIQDVSKTKQQFDDSRRSYRYSPYCYDEPYFTTGVDRRNRYYTPCYPTPTPYYGYSEEYYNYQPYLNVFNIPGYLGNTENHYDGEDNDNDKFIDEGFQRGNVQIILGDSGVNKDDEWSLYVDDSYMGDNKYGSTRNWDLNLYPGTHKVTIVGTYIPDDSGTYSIIFRNANVISGPPLVGENLKQRQILQWIIQVR